MFFVDASGFAGPFVPFPVGSQFNLGDVLWIIIDWVPFLPECFFLRLGRKVLGFENGINQFEHIHQEVVQRASASRASTRRYRGKGCTCVRERGAGTKSWSHKWTEDGVMSGWVWPGRVG